MTAEKEQRNTVPGDNPEGTAARRLSFEEALDRDGFICWRNVGGSMLPLIREGRDIMYIRKRPEGRLKKYDAVLYRRPGVTGRGAYVLHRICRVNPDGTYYIVGDNCCRGETVKEENILGILSAVRRKSGKTIRTDSLSCRMYSRLAYLALPLRFLYFHGLDAARWIWHRIRKKDRKNMLPAGSPGNSAAQRKHDP